MAKNDKAKPKTKYKKQKNSKPQEKFLVVQNDLTQNEIIEVPDSSTEMEIEAEETITVATAPYNFISLPAKVLASEIETGEKIKPVDAFKNHIKERGKISGEIVLEIETLTPLFFGGNSKAVKSFSPAGKFIIPGSSLRGMFKNIFKIVTCGAFRGGTNSQQKGEDFNDEHIYYRCLMGVNSLPWTKNLNKEYKARMESTIQDKDEKFRTVKNARPGFLIQTKDNKYFIAPSIHDYDIKNDKILILEYEKKFAPNIGNYDVKWENNVAYIIKGANNQEEFTPHINLRNSSRVEWENGTAYIITGSNGYLYNTQSYRHLTNYEKQRAGKQFIRFTKIDYVDWSKRIELPDEVIKSYEHDRNRRGVNLFTDKGILKRSELEKLCKNLPPDVETLIPCHFLYEGDKVTAFGHGQCFRIPYKNSIGDIVPKNLQSAEIIDFADAVFGSKENWAGRVFFEDATPNFPIKIFSTAAAHPLMQPNPTSYQLYLNQQGENLNHWDKVNATLRGYKIYWHNQTWDWKANESEKQLDAGKSDDKRLTKDITPLAKENMFKSKIRFQNLSAVELGALLMVFNLNGVKNPAYKIGMGKSFGFGSIRVTPTLFIESDTAYTELFDDDNNFKSPYCEKEFTEYLNAFKSFIDSQKMLPMWQKIMAELNLMLDWQNKPAPAKIKPMGNVPNNRGQMDLDERLKKRLPLPTALKVVQP